MFGLRMIAEAKASTLDAAQQMSERYATDVRGCYFRKGNSCFVKHV